MNARSLSFAAATALALAGLPLLGCATTPTPRTEESAGQWLDNTVITTRVKTALLAEPALKSYQIGVKSFKDTVQLSGFVDSHASAALAGRVTAAVPGVAAVKNDLIVK
jgi:osmotically-inducible protein OsmY